MVLRKRVRSAGDHDRVIDTDLNGILTSSAPFTTVTGRRESKKKKAELDSVTGSAVATGAAAGSSKSSDLNCSSASTEDYCGLLCALQPHLRSVIVCQVQMLQAALSPRML